MAGTIFQAYDLRNTSITITLNGLSNAATQYSTAVVNTGATVYLDALVVASCFIATTPTSDKAVYFYAYGTVDGGTTYTDGAAGTDERLANGARNARLIGVLSVTSPNLVMRGGPWSVAEAFGGVLRERWGIGVVNSTGTYLSNANTNANTVTYQAVYAQYV